MIPKLLLEKMEKEAAGIEYGEVTLCIEKKQGKRRFILRKEESFLEADDLSKEKSGRVNHAE